MDAAMRQAQMGAQSHGGGGADGSTWKADPGSPDGAMGSAAGEGIHLPTQRRRFPAVHWSLFVLCNHRVPAHFTPPPPPLHRVWH